MLTVYFHPFSFPSLSSLFTAEAIGLDYAREMVDLQKGDHKTPEYLAVNPYGRVPAIKDGDYCLSESAAIMRYLARKAKSPLYPKSIEAQGKVDQWMDFIAHHIRAAVGRVQFNRVLAPMIGAEVDPSSIALGLQFLERSLPAVEARLSEHGYLCGDALSLADIALVSALEPIEMAKIDISAYPKLGRWLKLQRAEKYYTNVHSHFGAEMGL